MQTAQAYPSPYQQPGYATPAQSGWEQHKTRLAALARQQGVREATIQAVIPYLQPNSGSMQLDRAQRPTSTSYYVQNFGPYLDRHITSSLINRGQSRYSAHWGNLSRIQAQYGVDPAVIMAIYGKETSYGAVTGSFDLLEALASLAYEGRRRAFFEDEFVATLKLLDQGVRALAAQGQLCRRDRLSAVHAVGRACGCAPTATATAMPTSGATRPTPSPRSPTICATPAGSADLPWGVPVRIPSNLNRAAIRLALNPPRCPRSIAATAAG